MRPHPRHRDRLELEVAPRCHHLRRVVTGMRRQHPGRAGAGRVGRFSAQSFRPRSLAEARGAVVDRELGGDEILGNVGVAPVVQHALPHLAKVALAEAAHECEPRPPQLPRHAAVQGGPFHAQAHVRVQVEVALLEHPLHLCPPVLGGVFLDVRTVPRRGCNDQDHHEYRAERPGHDHAGLDPSRLAVVTRKPRAVAVARERLVKLDAVHRLAVGASIPAGAVLRAGRVQGLHVKRPVLDDHLAAAAVVRVQHRRELPVRRRLGQDLTCRAVDKELARRFPVLELDRVGDVCEFQAVADE